LLKTYYLLDSSSATRFFIFFDGGSGIPFGNTFLFYIVEILPYDGKIFKKIEFKFDELVKSQNSDGKEKSSSSRRANHEE
jgi:hypothetical protein